ncbi:MAG: hypothetical protein ACI9WU_005057, partial [Myxococcota bacterium]
MRPLVIKAATTLAATLLCVTASAAPTRVSYLGELRQSGQPFTGQAQIQAALYGSAAAEPGVDAPAWPQSTDSAPWDFGTV